nr:hypothetical protein [Tanacetum cinerariifolium]
MLFEMSPTAKLAASSASNYVDHNGVIIHIFFVRFLNGAVKMRNVYNIRLKTMKHRRSLVSHNCFHFGGIGNGKHGIADISHFHCSIEKTNKENLDNHPIVVCILASMAIFAVGLISNSMGNANDVSVKKGDKIVVENVDLLAFWAPFLLCVAAVYVFAQSLPHNSLWIPTMLMFMTEPDPGPNYAKIMNEYISKKDANVPTRIQMVPEPYRAAKSANKAKKGI